MIDGRLEIDVAMVDFLVNISEVDDLAFWSIESSPCYALTNHGRLLS
jgi:hypothetical protein